MRTSQPLPPRLRGVPFSLLESDALGVPRHRSRTGGLFSPSRLIRIPGKTPLTLLARCRPYVAVTRDGVISHDTAALLHRLYLPSRLETPKSFHITRPPGVGAPRRKNVTGHRLALRPGDVVTLGGVPLTSIKRTWLDMAGILSLDELVIMGDQIVSEHLNRPYGPPKFAMVSLAELNEYLATLRHVPGLANARMALKLICVGVDSPPETQLRLLLHRAGMPEFTADYAVVNESNVPLRWTDLGCEAFKTCVQYEGGHHLTSRQQALDHNRDYEIVQAGWHQAKINKEDMKDGGREAIRKVARMLVRGGWADPLNLAEEFNRRPGTR